MCVDNQWHFNPAIVAILVLKMGVQLSNILTIKNRVTFGRNVSIKEAPDYINQVIHESLHIVTLHAQSLVMIWTANIQDKLDDRSSDGEELQAAQCGTMNSFSNTLCFYSTWKLYMIGMKV